MTEPFFSLKILVYSHQNRPRFDFVLSSREEVLQLKSLESSCNNFSQSTGNEIKKKKEKKNSKPHLRQKELQLFIISSPLDVAQKERS